MTWITESRAVEIVQERFPTASFFDILAWVRSPFIIKQVADPTYVSLTSLEKALTELVAGWESLNT